MFNFVFIIFYNTANQFNFIPETNEYYLAII